MEMKKVVVVVVALEVSSRAHNQNGARKTGLSNIKKMSSHF